MKLIIDIDDNDYEYIKDLRSLIIGSRDNCKTIQYNVINAIKNGKPISNTGDLISRSDLNQTINKVVDEEIGIDEKWAKGLKYSLKIIDKAPRVDAIVNTIEVRTQADWVENHCDYGVYYLCSNCHKMPPNYECDYKEGAIKTNFCPNCGADMRGDSNG